MRGTMGVTLTTAMLIASAARAGDVAVERVVFERSGGAWRVSVTLRHDDTGWDHYADAWRVVAVDGAVLGTRVLHHPHENEQPFTRSLGGVAIPEDTARVRVEAHDKVHGWSPDTVTVELGAASGDRFEVRR